MYSGGMGLAGFHTEDGMLDFAHVIPDMSFHTHDMLLLRLLTFLKSFSTKIWIFYKDSSAQGAITLNTLLVEKGFPEQKAGLDEVLISRSVVMDPRFISTHSPLFEVVHHKVGECLVSAFPHCVLGFAMFSFAWNICLKSRLSEYIEKETSLAEEARRIVDSFTAARQRWGVPVKRNFVVATHAMWALVYKPSLPSSVADAIARAIAPLWIEEGVDAPDFIKQSFDAPLISAFACQCFLCAQPIIRRAYHPARAKYDETSPKLYCKPCAIKNQKTRFKQIVLFGSNVAAHHGITPRTLTA